MPIKQKVKGSLVIQGKQKHKAIASILPLHGYNTKEGWLPVTLDLIEKLELIAKSRYTTEEHREIVKAALNSIDLTRARARETIMISKSDLEIQWDIAREKKNKGDTNGST